MERQAAIKIIVDHNIAFLGKEERKCVIAELWGLNEEDWEFSSLSPALQSELLHFKEPQYDAASDRYDQLVRIYCEANYSTYSNQELEIEVSKILKSNMRVEGLEPEKYICPCCGEKTLSLPRGEYDICSICWWEDDGTESENNFSSVNNMTLGEAHRNYLKTGNMYGKDL